MEEGFMAQQQKALEKAERIPTLLEKTEDLFEAFEKNTAEIAKRAFELFRKRGGEFGRELEDWIRAESEVVRRIPLELKESEGMLEIKAEVPGFKPEELKVVVEPLHLTIKGEVQEKSEEEKGEKLYSEWRANKFFRSFGLPRRVEAEKAVATLKDGVLKLKVPKAPGIEEKGIEVKPE